VARAVIGAGGSLTSLAIISIEASALTSGAIADSSASALEVLVESSLSVGGVDPRDLERADALRAVTRVIRQAHSPVVVAFADVISAAISVARALVVTSSTDGANEGDDQKNSIDHFSSKSKSGKKR